MPELTLASNSNRIVGGSVQSNGGSISPNPGPGPSSLNNDDRTKPGPVASYVGTVTASTDRDNGRDPGPMESPSDDGEENAGPCSRRPSPEETTKRAPGCGHESFGSDPMIGHQRVRLKVGLRSVSLIRDQVLPAGEDMNGEREGVGEADEELVGGESFFFRVNGVDVFARGSNWVPPDAWGERCAHVDGVAREPFALLEDTHCSNDACT